MMFMIIRLDAFRKYILRTPYYYVGCIETSGETGLGLGVIKAAKDSGHVEEYYKSGVKGDHF